MEEEGGITFFIFISSHFIPRAALSISKVQFIVFPPSFSFLQTVVARIQLVFEQHSMYVRTAPYVPLQASLIHMATILATPVFIHLLFSSSSNVLLGIRSSLISADCLLLLPSPFTSCMYSTILLSLSLSFPWRNLHLS